MKEKIEYRGSKVAIRMILQGTSGQHLSWASDVHSTRTYFSCSFGLLKRSECLIIEARMTKQVAAVQAPERIMLNL